jgi:hypothetical protein
MTHDTSNPLITLGIVSTKDDYGACVAVQALRMYHPAFVASIELVILDVAPTTTYSIHLHPLISDLADSRYARLANWSAIAARDYLFRIARGTWVVVIDPYVMIDTGALLIFLNYLHTHLQSRDLLHGSSWLSTICGIDTYLSSLSMSPQSHSALRNSVSTSSRYPLDMFSHQWGILASRRDAWPRCNPRMYGSSGDIFYLFHKVLHRGYHTVRLPFLKWNSSCPQAPDMTLDSELPHYIRNCVIGCDELQMDYRPLMQRLASSFGESLVLPVFESVRREISGPFFQFDAVYSISDTPGSLSWSDVKLQALIRCVCPVNDAPTSECGRVLTHRRILVEAHKQDLRSILVCDERVSPAFVAQQLLRDVNLRGVRSSLVWRFDGATAYNSAALDELITTIPDAPHDLDQWIDATGGLEALVRKMRYAT